MIIQLGIRNLFRNKRRSFLASLAIGIGLASLIVFDGVWSGLMSNMVSSVTKTYLGHIQIHNKKFNENRQSEFYISDYEDILKKLTLNKDIQAYSTRVLATAMVNSAYDSNNVQMVGISPRLEKEVSIFSQRILKGSFLNNDDEIMIGKSLSEKLQVEIGDRIVLTTSEIDSGQLSQSLFRVSAIYGIGTKTIDEFMVILHENKARKMLAIKSGVHEIVIKLKDPNLLNDSNFITKIVNDNELSVKSWKELAPQLVAAINLYDISITVMATILLSLVSLGILNTMFMSLYERMFEFGVLRALGTRGRQILLMILSEGAALALSSILIGIFIGAAFGQYFAVYGIDYLGVEFAEVTFTEKIYFLFRWQQFVYFPLIIFVFTLLITLYPGMHAVRITMAKALHKSL